MSNDNDKDIFSFYRKLSNINIDDEKEKVQLNISKKKEEKELEQNELSTKNPFNEKNDNINSDIKIEKNDTINFIETTKGLILD